MKELRRRGKNKKEGQKEAEMDLTWDTQLLFPDSLAAGWGGVDPVGGNKMETDYFSNQKRQNRLTHSFCFSPSSWHLAAQRIKVSHRRWWTKQSDGMWTPGNLVSRLPPALDFRHVNKRNSSLLKHCGQVSVTCNQLQSQLPDNPSVVRRTAS